MSHTSPISIDNMSSEETKCPNVDDVSCLVTGVEKISLSFDTSYKGDELKQKVAKILGIESSQGWSVVDEHENLALVHYNEDNNDHFDEALHGHLRGVLVDTEVGAIIANSFGYTPKIIGKSLQDDNGFISVITENGEKVQTNFSSNDAMIKRVFEGVVIRVIWHKGQAYRLTHKKIKPLRSRWGSSPTFLSMYEAAGGPTDDQLFDTTKPYSSSCYAFLVSHPSLLVGTRQNVTCPYIVCLAHFQVNTGRPADQVAPGISNFTSDDNITGIVNEPFIHNPRSLSLDEANHHLQFGYYNGFEVKDERQLTGEAVILCNMVDGQVSDIIKIHSPSYEWRSTMRGNNPNISNQFYSMLNSVYRDINTEESWESFKKKFILFPLYDEQSLKDLYNENKSILTIPEGNVTKDMYSTRDSRIQLLWMNYILSLPASIQSDALNILTQFRKDRDDLINWLQLLEKNKTENPDLPDRVKALISSSRRLAQERVRGGNNYSAKGSYMNLPTLIKSTLRNLINKENGPSLYALVREMKRSRQPPQTPQPQPNNQ